MQPDPQEHVPRTAGPYRRPLTLLLAAALGWILLGVIRSASPAGNGLAARYYANTAFAGPPAEAGYDAVPSSVEMMRRWRGHPPPSFSAVWTGYLVVDAADLYSFATTSDDGSRLYVDDRLVVDNGGPHSPLTRSGAIQLSRGAHRIRLEYTQFGAGSELAWLWARGAAALAPVPEWALSRREVRVGTATAARAIDLARSALAMMVVLTLAWCIGLVVQRVPAARLTKRATHAYASGGAMAASAGIVTAILLMPWPDGHGAPLVRSVAVTLTDLARAVVSVLHDPRGFQANLVQPLAGEQVVGPRVQQAVAMLRAQGVDRYQLSAGVAADDWTYQQIVATAWPRRRDPDAHATLVLNTEPTGGCSVVTKGRDVSLVDCP
jgi:hypothetical protein